MREEAVRGGSLTLKHTHVVVTHDSVRLCRLIDCVFKETQLVNRKLRVVCESDTMLVVSYGPKCVFWTLWNMILKQQGA